MEPAVELRTDSEMEVVLWDSFFSCLRGQSHRETLGLDGKPTEKLTWARPGGHGKKRAGSMAPVC